MSGHTEQPVSEKPVRDFEGKVVLVTGGATGIGRAAALAFARRGALVVIAGRRRTEGDAAVAALSAIGATGRFIPTDVTSPDALADLHRTILADHGRLDVAFNNAGYQEPRATIAEQDAGLYDRVFDTNVRSVYLCLQHQIRHMAERGGGAIVVNASVSGLRNPNPGLALYSASKAAVISLTRSAAMEYAEKGVRINAVAPGRVVTDMMLASKIMDMNAVAAGLPLRRMGKPEEVAEAVVWLASGAASFVVGHVLCADGGFMAL
ncbi:MAG: glucose 1-dehydrogenase [Proteobacteria bacterium]|nr:glucose 1-dehydrogenase [Pseudomonadota bacterium]